MLTGIWLKKSLTPVQYCLWQFRLMMSEVAQGVRICKGSYRQFGLYQRVRAIFIWPWNENAWTKQKEQLNGNRAIWLVYWTDTKARGFWLVKRKLGWKNLMPKNFLEIKQYFAFTSYCNTIGQSNNAFSI